MDLIRSETIEETHHSAKSISLSFDKEALILTFSNDLKQCGAKSRPAGLLQSCAEAP